ncbi:RhoGAP domain-containing protein 7 [Elsinoe fawcettii]|nr:RhoGAP domain-containing protein 7 [Elsinoe fawcettii]
MSRQQAAGDQVDDFEEARDFYTSYQPTSQSPRLEPTSFSSPPRVSTTLSPPTSSYTHGTATSQARTLSRSPTRQQRSTLAKNSASHITTSRSRTNTSTPNKRDFKDLVTRFNQDEAPIVPLTTQERYRRAQQIQKPAKLMKPRSPTKPGHNKLQTRREPPNSRLPTRIDTSARGLTASVSQDGFMSSASPRSPKRRTQRPLFGEVVYDPVEIQELGYGISPTRHHARRGSESSIMKGTAHVFHIRTPAEDNLALPELARSSGDESSKHSRSRSDQTTTFRHDSLHWAPDDSSDLSRYSDSPYANLPFLGIPHTSSQPLDPHQTTPTRAQSQPRLVTNSAGESRARTPVSKYQRPPRIGVPPSVGRRTPATPKSPPLRSSRPRQPVSAASTASSRAKASERLAKSVKSGDEDPNKPRPRKKDPVLGRVDLAERRARIERAISVNLEERPDFDRRSSRASSTRRRSSAASQFDDMANPPDDAGLKAAITLDPVGENPKSPLVVDTHNVSLAASGDPDTAETEFEEDDSPDLAAKMGRLANGSPHERSLDGSIQNTPIEFSPHRNGEPRSLFTEVLKYREGTSPATPETAGTTPQEPEDLNQVRVKLDGRQIHIGNSPLAETVTLETELGSSSQEHAPATNHLQVDSATDSLAPHTPVESPDNFLPSDSDVTPRQLDCSSREVSHASQTTDRTRGSEETFMQRIIGDFERTGHIDPSLLVELESRGLGSHGTTGLANGSDAQTIEILLDRFTYHPPPPAPAALPELPKPAEELELLTPARYGALDTFQTPQHDPGYFESKTSPRLLRDISAADIYQTPGESMDAGEQLSSARFGEESDNATPGAESLDNGPTPPPKDERWSVGSSLKYASGTTSVDANHLSPTTARFDRNSQQSMSLPEIEVGGPLDDGLGFEEPDSPPHAGIKPPPSPPAPAHAPPPPPMVGDAFIIEPQPPSEPPTPDSPTVGMHSAPLMSSSLRPSEESQRAGSSSVPASQSMSSISQTSINAEYTDRSSPALAEDKEPSQVERRLNKRRNIIKELVDTEYSYHQDMKIIEDIYKATVGGLISAEDKKVLFGNVDQVEALSLDLYDAFRRAVAPFYVPQKSTRWQTKRGSGTSAGTDPQASEQPSEDQDKLTAIGMVFEKFLPRVEEVYSFYLKNHENANKRLAVLQEDPTVMCWLKECHNNASDITSAWDLDSLLVKPVQRILKYPLLLQQLLAVTPPDHPDHAALSRSVIESTNVSQRINDAKRRADLVESIVQRKKKDTDVRSGLAKAFGLRTDKVKERIGIKNEYQDSDYEDLAMKFGGHYVRLQVVMRDVQGSLTEIDRAVEKFNAFAMALEGFIDVGQCMYPEIESKWRKFILAIRELSNVALADHKNQIKKRVIDPIVTALRLHESPQNIMAKRKKRMVDYARCKQMEKQGQKPDKKLLEGAEMYTALNEQLKIDLPKLYSLTAQLIQRCLACHHQIQQGWLWVWQSRLAPVLEMTPESWEQILPEFHAEHDLVATQLYSLGLCNGSLLHEASQFLSPQLSFITSDEAYRPSRADGISSRTQSIGSEYSPSLHQTEMPRTQSSAQLSGFYNANVSINGQQYSRARSSSNLSTRDIMQRGRATSVPRPDGTTAPRLPSQTPKSSFSTSRPPTASRPSDLYTLGYPYQRGSVDAGGSSSQRPSRPDSGTSYFSAQQDPADRSQRFSGIFSSAMPMNENAPNTTSALAGIGMGIAGVAYPGTALGSPPAGQGVLQQAPTQQSFAASLAPSSSSGGGAFSSPSPASLRVAPPDQPVMFVAVSMFEFNIDRSRKESGHAYLTYDKGEVFDVVGQKGELWLAMNQDDEKREVGWIWEQHFVILGREA